MATAAESDDNGGVTKAMHHTRAYVSLIVSAVTAPRTPVGGADRNGGPLEVVDKGALVHADGHV